MRPARARHQPLDPATGLVLPAVVGRAAQAKRAARFGHSQSLRLQPIQPPHQLETIQRRVRHLPPGQTAER